MFFAYGEKEITYLKQKDKRLDMFHKIGMVEREVDTDLFSAVFLQIISSVKGRFQQKHRQPSGNE